jgi:hypothetical protein
MHGIIFAELQNYAETRHGKGTWSALLKKAGLEHRVYLPIQEYPDAEAVGVVVAASTLTGLPVSEVLEDFGEFVVPALIKMYGHLLWPEWKTIDVIDNTEGAIHTVVRSRNAGAKPPNLRTIRNGKEHITLIYASPRQMCALAIGYRQRLGKALQRGTRN